MKWNRFIDAINHNVICFISTINENTWWNFDILGTTYDIFQYFTNTFTVIFI